MFCTNCGTQLNEDVSFCPNCGINIKSNNNNVTNDGSISSMYKNLMSKQKNKFIAAALAIFLGSCGIHNFYLGNNVKGTIQLVMFVCWFGWASGIWSFVEGLLILFGNINKDAFNIPLSNKF